MRKTNDGTKFGRFEDRALDDAELNVVTGGSVTLAYTQVKFEYTEQKGDAAPPKKG